jgi:hypothetical protein
MAKDQLTDRDDPRDARPAGQRGTAGDQGTGSQGAGATSGSAAGDTGAGAASGRAANRGHHQSAADAAGGQHHAAAAHGRPARIDRSLPADRGALIALHAEARRRRSQAALGSEAYRAAVDEIGRIEVRIADVDRAADPPQG